MNWVSAKLRIDIDCAKCDKKWQLLARDICHEKHERALPASNNWMDGVIKAASRYLPIVQKKQEAHVPTCGKNPHTL